MGGKIVEVLADSIAEELGLEPGDELLAIDGEPVTDMIDYDYRCAEEFLLLSVRKPDGDVWDCEVEKYPEEDLGLVFAADVFDGIRPCRNHCLVCFIDQLQPEPRRSLLLRDDDYRMSFLEGNFITCTNLSDEDYRRIGEMRLSPLYISVHSVEPLLRQRLLGRRQPTEILLTLQRLISLGCTLHTQIVLCPDINDGEHLEKTVDALAALYPGVASAAVVPVGLTRFCRNPELRLYTPAEAAAVIDLIEERQRRFCARLGEPFLFASDELYLRAGRPFPPAELYGDFPQLENGVGMAALFDQQWQKLRRSLPHYPVPDGSTICTGVSGAVVLRPVIDAINAMTHSHVKLLPVENRFYGPTVTATGLLTGSDLLAAVQPGEYRRILICSNMLKFDEDVFLDNMTVDQVAERLRMPVVIVDPEPGDLIAALFEER